MLTAADSLSGMDFYDITSQSADITEGRCPAGVGHWEFFTQPTPGSRNCDLVPAVEGVPGAWRPTPFAGETRLVLDLPSAGAIELVLYTVDGRSVRTLRAEAAPPDSQVVVWDGRDDSGRALPSGMYFPRLKSGGRKLLPLLLVR